MSEIANLIKVMQEQMQLQREQMQQQLQQQEERHQQQEKRHRQQEERHQQQEERHQQEKERHRQQEERQEERHQRQLDLIQKQLDEQRKSGGTFTSQQQTPPFPAFDLTAELWKDYLLRFKTLVSANSVFDDKLALVFLTNQTSDTYNCIVLYCIMRPYTDGPIGPLSYRHSSGVVRNPHSALAE